MQPGTFPPWLAGRGVGSLLLRADKEPVLGAYYKEWMNQVQTKRPASRTIDSRLPELQRRSSTCVRMAVKVRDDFNYSVGSYKVRYLVSDKSLCGLSFSACLIPLLSFQEHDRLNLGYKYITLTFETFCL